jgi:chlorobactene glucosyltransferase
MNGQFLAIRAGVYDASGGFAAVRSALAEDAALGRRLVALGYAVGLLDGAGLLTCRPYGRAREAWSANVRNLGAVLGGSTALLLLAAAALAAVYVAPLVLLALGILRHTPNEVLLTGLPIAEIALGVVPRLVTDARAGYPRWVALLHPLAIGALVGMCLQAAARARRGRPVTWRGRTYDQGDRAA